MDLISAWDEASMEQVAEVSTRTSHHDVISRDASDRLLVFPADALRAKLDTVYTDAYCRAPPEPILQCD